MSMIEHDIANLLSTFVWNPDSDSELLETTNQRPDQIKTLFRDPLVPKDVFFVLPKQGHEGKVLLGVRPVGYTYFFVLIKLEQFIRENSGYTILKG